MSGTLRVLAPEELQLIAGGSMTGAGDPNWMPPTSSYSGMGINVPVFSATSFTTSSAGSNYGYYSYLAGQLGYSSANAFLQANPYTYTPDTNATHVNYYGYVNGYVTTEGSHTTTGATSNTSSVSTGISYQSNGDIAIAPPPPAPSTGDTITVSHSLIKYGDPGWLLYSTLVATGTPSIELISLTNGGSTVGDDDNTDHAELRYTTPGFETEDNYFHLNKAQLVADIRAKPDVTFAANIVVDGKVFHIEVGTHAFADALEDYDFYFNYDYGGTGVGQSYGDFSVLDPNVFLTGAGAMSEANLNWVAMHEYAHQVLASVDNALWNSWLHDPAYSSNTAYDQSVPQMLLNEQYADALLSAIAGYAGLPIDSNVASQLPTNPFTQQP